MSVPDSRCVRVVTPDDHVNIGFHEVLIHDLEDDDLPFVTVSELGCLRLDWPKTLLSCPDISLLSCPDISLIWIKCAKTDASDLGPRSRGLVLIVVYISSRI